MTTCSQNKEIVEQYLLETWQRGDLEAAAAFLAPCCVFHAEGLAQGDRRQWRQAVADFLAAHHQHIEVCIEEMIAEGDKVAARWSGRGRRASTVEPDPAAGEDVVYHVMGHYRLAGGKIEQAWVVFCELDMAGLAATGKRG